MLDAAFRLVVDPVDGTDNLLRGSPLSALSLALLPKDRPLHPQCVLAALVGPLDEASAPLIVGPDREVKFATSGVQSIGEALATLWLIATVMNLEVVRRVVAFRLMAGAAEPRRMANWAAWPQ